MMKITVIGALTFILTVVVIAAVFVVSGGRDAFGHGDASWIMSNPDTAYCCGPRDCGWVSATEVRMVGGHYVIDKGVMITNQGPIISSPGISVPVDSTMMSRDHHFWVCMVGERVRCFFAPALGM